MVSIDWASTIVRPAKAGGFNLIVPLTADVGFGWELIFDRIAEEVNASDVSPWKSLALKRGWEDDQRCFLIARGIDDDAEQLRTPCVLDEVIRRTNEANRAATPEELAQWQAESLQQAMRAFRAD